MDVDSANAQSGPVQAVSHSRVGGLPASRGLPGSNSLFFCVAKRKVSKRKGDPMVRVPCAALRGNLRCSLKAGSRSNSPSAQTIAIPDPLLPVLLGPARRVGEEDQQPNANTGFNPEHEKRAALLVRESQQTVMFARERSTRDQMKSPSIAQRGEGGVRGGSVESPLLPLASCLRSVMQTFGLLAHRGLSTLSLA